MKKTLSHHQIIFDDECPLCNAYTNAFIKSGMLSPNGRVPYQIYAQTNVHGIDLPKSKNQIALVNTQTGEVTYGLDSMLKILQYRFPFVKYLFSIKIIYWFFIKMYSFISYNRKVIAPAKMGRHTCYPDFNVMYRVVFIFFCWVIATIILTAYASLFHFQHYPKYLEAFLLLAQMPYQYLFMKNKNREVVLNYFGHLFFLSFFGCILLIPALIGSYFIALPPLFILSYFLAVVVILIAMHIKRVGLLQLNYGLCFSWVAYRLLLLAYILLTNYNL